MGFEDQMMKKDKYSVSAYFSQVEPILFYCLSNILKRAGKNGYKQLTAKQLVQHAMLIVDQ